MENILDRIRVTRERLTRQEHFLEELKTSFEGLRCQEHFLEELKTSAKDLLSKEQLQELVSAYRESLVRQETLLQESLPPSLPNLWRPPVHDEALSWRLPALKLRKFEQTTGEPDILVSIKRTWIGRLYVNHVKPVTIVRCQINRLWRILYPIYINTFSVYLGLRASRRWRPLLKLGDYVKTSHLSTANLFDAIRVDTPAPKVYPVDEQAFLVAPHDHYVFPPVYVAELGEALIYGGTNLVFAQDAVICHDLYYFGRDYTSEELHGRHVIDAKKKFLRLIRSDSTPKDIPVAAAFLDACAPNYAHWLTEVLPRIAAFCSVEQHANIPIIIDEGLHPNIMESLALVVGEDREVITLPVGRAINVGILYITSVTGYVPFERRNTQLAGHSHGVFHSLAFDLLNKRLLSFANKLSLQDYPRKIYLRRNSGGRKITNANEIEELLADNGYVVVEPEKLTFLQQFVLFSGVDEIVAPSGAALANLIFSRPDVRVHILIGKYEGTSYWYWQNMACASGKTINYILGDIAEVNLGIHSDFSIDRQMIDSIIGENK